MAQNRARFVRTCCESLAHTAFFSFAADQFGPELASTRPSGRAGERIGESPSHGLFEERSRRGGIFDRNLQHDLVVQPRDRAAVDPFLEKGVVDGGERQHR